MIIPLEPKLEGLAERRFHSFARQILDLQGEGEHDRISALVEAETNRVAALSELKGQRDEFTACVRVLGDLSQLRWTLVESGYGLELHSPRPQVGQISSSYEVRQRKETIRNELRPRVMQQFEDQNVRKFIHKMENPPASSRQKSISSLIADGAEVKRRLHAAREHQADDAARTDALRMAVRPYLQLVEASVLDEHTRIPLRDIWRYCRYTWSIPQTPIPGRHLHYLVRDAAHVSHAVIGIAALSNCAVQMVPRDSAIGWNTSGLKVALSTLFAPAKEREAREARELALRFQGIYQWLKQQFPVGVDPAPENKLAALERVVEWLRRGISSAIGEIEQSGLVTQEEISAPTQQVVDRLRHLGKEFAFRRQEALAGDPNDGVVTSFGGTVPADAPVDDSVLALEAKHSSNAPVNNSRRLLVRKKRALDLARLLDADRVLVANRERMMDPETVFAAMEREEVRIAVNTAINAIKSQRIGTNLLEITTCGAVAPYNRILGGKLVALLLLSPQVATDYKRRYGSEPAIIRSQLKNTRVVPDNTLVWLGTTSLFSHGSSQYERLRLPAGVITPEQPEIRFCYLGDTTGYGTVQFADDTVRALESVMRRKRGYRDVNGVFGEGASPRLRKLRSGLDALGFNASLTMLHHQERRIYGVPLFAEAGVYLCGLDLNTPDYISSPESYVDASERIAEFWRQRWLSSRLKHDASWAALGETEPWLLSTNIPVHGSEQRPVLSGSGREDDSDNSGDGSSDEAVLAFWRRLAQAGSNTVSEGLTDNDFEALHIEMPLEDYLLAQARKGISIVLTGNAGDGKTHLARALQRRLEGDADRFEFAFDATAIMTNHNGVSPIIEKWRQALNDGKIMVLAINQFPLYMLRRELKHTLPDVSDAIEQQWRARLNVDTLDVSPNDGLLILIDLSLRNPLSRHFARPMLDKMLTSPAIVQYAASNADPNFSYNFRRLSHSKVKERMFELFERVVSSGGRATIRELWILYARLLFGTSGGFELPGAFQAWYSERLFSLDARFPLSEALCSVADPAMVSHPRIDRQLEVPGGTKAGDWFINGEQPNILQSPTVGIGGSNEDRDSPRKRFAAIKRRFYFEHKEGGETHIFKLDDSSHSHFHTILRSEENDTEHLYFLVEAINRCYFPHDFEGKKEKLCLWVGHRLDEQPTKSFVASECIPHDRLIIRRPVPIGVPKNVLEYVPDHLFLSAKNTDGTVSRDLSLRVDAGLFKTLWVIRHGLPRHLINPGELNRLDSFIDRLRHVNPAPLAEFLIYNAEHVASSSVKISTNPVRYVNIHRF